MGINASNERVKFTFYIGQEQKLNHSDQCEAKLSTMPIIINEETKNDPPADKNGSGRPFTGISPTVIAEFTNT